MDKSNLVAALDAEIRKGGRSEEAIIFIRLLKEVWQIDWTVAPYEVWCHMIGWDVPYFLRFMKMDAGDEAAENQLIIDWMLARMRLRGKETNSGQWKDQVLALIDDMNRLRATVRQQTR